MSIWKDETGEVIAGLNSSVMTEKEFFEREIEEWKASETRRLMIEGERYFRGDHDILKEERWAIGDRGAVKRLENLPNNHIVDNQYQRLVNQKVNYLLGREAMLDGENEEYLKLFGEALGKDWSRMLKCIMRDCINMGIAWLYLYTDENGRLCFKRIPSYEMIAYWKDDEHTMLDCAVRVYDCEGYKGDVKCTYEMVEIYRNGRVGVYEYENGRLRKTGEHLYFKETGIPIVAFKYNEKEIPLILRVKPLQDAINKTLSDFQNRLQEDCRNTILVLQNYDGTDLGEFRQNLAQYGAVKVKSVDGYPGDVRALSTDFKAENYSAMVALLKSAMVENAMGYDPKNDKLGNNPNQMVMKSMFSDLDLDVSEAEVELRFSFNQMRKLVDEYLEIYGKGYFENEMLDIVFSRDSLINESEAIDNCVKSMGILSDETVLREHPWVKSVKKEIEKRRSE